MKWYYETLHTVVQDGLDYKTILNIASCLKSKVHSDILMLTMDQEEQYNDWLNRFQDAYNFQDKLKIFKEFLNQEWIRDKMTRWEDLSKEEKKEWLED